MLIIGLTGSFGSGKTTVARLFKEQGAQVIDADSITRTLIEPGGEGVKKVAKVFGHVILKQGKIDRALLAKIVFQDPRELKKLTDILYPIGLNEIKKKIAKEKNAKLIILDVPLLFESGWNKLADVTIVVQSNQNLQIKRLQKRTGLSTADIKRRFKCQMPMKEKLQRADIIINNRTTINQTRAQVKAIYQRLLTRANIKPTRRNA
jgi:dephospho-CoA kinase